MASPGTLRPKRIVIAALAISVLVHAAVLVGVPSWVGPEGQADSPPLSVHLEPMRSVAEVEVAPAPVPAPKPRRKPRSSTPALAALPLAFETEPAFPEALWETAPAAPAPLPPAEEAQPVPELLALAQPATPVPALAPPEFPAEALPSRITINYTLTSPLADGSARYTWTRDGDRYEISGRAQAEGFFTLFLEGEVTQESRGTVTAAGLRPERFVEHKPRGGEEGLEFDWPNRTITFSRKDGKRQGQLDDNTMDWLSMIFQLAHLPPSADNVPMRVYTQRRLYDISLKSLGVETLELPIGTVRALHLRHEGARPEEAVDVWLGLDHHNLPVKLRFPVARNRFMVEQVATSITGR